MINSTFYYQNYQFQTSTFRIPFVPTTKVRLINPDHYHLINFEIPRIRQSEVKQFIKHKLKTLYPGNLNEIIFDYKITGAKNILTATVVLIDRPDIYKLESNQLFSVLPLLLKPVKEDCEIVVSFPEYYEIIKFNGYKPISHIRIKGTHITKSDDVFNYTPQVQKTGVNLLAHKFLKTENQSDRVLILNRRPPSRIPLIAGCGFLLLNILLLVLLLTDNISRKHDYIQVLKKNVNIMMVQNNEKIILKREYDEVCDQYHLKKQTVPINMLHFLKMISDSIGRSSNIISLQMDNRKFRLNLYVDNSLVITEKFLNNPHFKDIRIEQTYVSQNSTLEKFVIEGEYLDVY